MTQGTRNPNYFLAIQITNEEVRFWGGYFFNPISLILCFDY